jgi:ABC-2 type transport system permease protein
MNGPPPIPQPPPVIAATPPPLPPSRPPISSRKALHKLFLTLFLRGRSARGLQKQGAPQSIGKKLALSLFFYGVIGTFATSAFIHQPVFALSVYLHATTFFFLGMFVAASSGELLFNKEEPDILLHRPVTSKALLWAKISVLVRVSLWLAGALNLAGCFIGLAASNGSPLFPIVHAASTVLEALFCAGAVVLLYQLCLRWFGRERLDGLMTLAQVMVAIAAVFASQVPRLFMEMRGALTFNFNSPWIYVLPPAWFAGIDDSLAGSHSTVSIVLAVIACLASAIILWLAFDKLAGGYETGLQSINEALPQKIQTPGAPRRRWLDALSKRPPLRWWLRDPVSRASFLLVAAYLARDRDVKLRVYPGLAPVFVMPIILFFQGGRHSNPDAPGMLSGFGTAYIGAYIGMIPLFALDLLRYSQQWQAADLFHLVPIRGPGSICDGARRAVLFTFTIPAVLAIILIASFLGADNSRLPLLLPGLITLPVYAMIGCLRGKAVPFSLPTEEAKSASRGLMMIGVMIFSAVLAFVASLTWNKHWFLPFLLIETTCAAAIYFSIRASLRRCLWDSLE